MKKGILKRIICFVIIAVATGFVLYFSLKDNYKNIIHEIKTINKFWLLVAFFLLFGYWTFKALARKNLVNKFNKNYRFRDSFKLFINKKAYKRYRCNKYNDTKFYHISNRTCVFRTSCYDN